MNISKIEAFLRRDFLFHWSYKFWFLYELGGLLSTVLTLYFVSQMIGPYTPAAVAAYKTDYFTFALLGMAFVDYMWVSLKTYGQQVRIAQVMGTLEAMLVTPTHPFTIIGASAAYTYLWTLARTFVYVAFGTLVFGADISPANPFSVFAFILLTVFTFTGIGLSSAALTLYLKQSDPLTSLIGGISFLFGGIVYPVQSLPEIMQKVAWVLPMTHAVEGLRQATLLGHSLDLLYGHALVLALWGVVSFPLAFLMLRWVLRALSREGTFSAY